VALKKKIFALPVQVTGRTDINRLGRELEQIEQISISSSAAKGKAIPAPRPSNILTQLAASNSYDLSRSDGRQQLAAALAKIHDHAPLLHISFASEPSPKVVETLLQWLRSNIHVYALLQIGLAPAIGAGCVLRTPNKIFDLSLGASLQKQKPYLVQLIKGAALKKPAPVTATGDK